LTTTENAHAVTVQTVEPRNIAAVHARVLVEDIPKTFARYLDQVYAAAKAGAVQLDGQNVFLYRCVTDRRSPMDLAFGVGVLAPFKAVGAVEPTQVPGGEVATTTHLGSYAGLREAHDAVIEWCRYNGRRLTGTSWEVYGHWVDDETKLRTDIFYQLEPASRT
jgi:effector-binding domain-containing protein